MDRRWILAGVLPLVLAAASISVAQTPQEAKLVKDLYGNRISDALGTADPADNISLARELASSAADKANPKLLRHLLAMEAVRLTKGLGSTEAYALASEALSLAHKLKGLDPLVKAKLSLGIVQARHAMARREGAGSDAMGQLAQEVSHAELGVAEALIAKGRLNEAESLLGSALVKAKRADLYEMEEHFQTKIKELRTTRIKLARIRSMSEQLQQAIDRDDTEGIRRARQSLGLVYLLADADIVKANKYLAGTGHAYESAVAAAARYVQDQKKLPPAEGCNDVIESFCRIAKSAETRDTRVQLAQVATDICNDFLKMGPKGLVAAKARLLLAQAEKLSENTPADRFLRKLKVSYGGLAGKIEVVRDGVIRATYDFSSGRQLSDWTIEKGPWRVIANRKILATVPVPASSEYARVSSRLCFRADRPLTMSLQVSGQQDLVSSLVFLRQIGKRVARHEVTFVFGGSDNRSSWLIEGHSQEWSSDKLRVVPNRTYTIRVSWDGKAKTTWSINSTTICEDELREESRDQLASISLMVALAARAKPAGFDNVIIEGTVVEDPAPPPPSEGKKR